MVPLKQRKLNDKYSFSKDIDKQKKTTRINDRYQFDTPTTPPKRKIKPEYTFSEENTGITKDDFKNPEILLKKVEHALNRKIIGQEHITQFIARDLYRHMQQGTRIAQNEMSIENLPSLAPVHMLIGPSSVGKTLTAIEAANIFNLPIGQISCTRLTEEGYVGQSVQDVYLNLLQNAKTKYVNLFMTEEEQKQYVTATKFIAKLKQGLIRPDLHNTPESISAEYDKSKQIIETTEKDILQFAQNFGIIILDEFDKLAQNKAKIEKVNDTGVQESLLSYLDGKIPVELTMPDEHSPNPQIKKSVLFQTRNTLIFLTGAFEGIEDIIATTPKNTDLEPCLDDFNDSPAAHQEKRQYEGLQPEHLHTYGIIDQLLKRVRKPLYIFRKLSPKDLRKIFLTYYDQLIKDLNDHQLNPDFTPFERVYFESSHTINYMIEQALKTNTDGRSITNFVQAFPTLIGLYVRDHKESLTATKELAITEKMVREALLYDPAMVVST